MSANTADDGPRRPRSGAGLRGLLERALWAVAAAALSSAIVLFAFRSIPPLIALETQLNDIQRVLIAPREAAQDPRVTIVALTEETLVRFPYRSPVDRGYLARLMRALAEAGVRAVVLDILFDQPSEPAKDRALISAIRDFPGPVIAAWGDQRSGLIEAQREYLSWFAAESGLVLGFANVITDDDGVVRRFATRLPGIDRASLSGAAALAIGGGEPMREGVIDWRAPKTANATLFQQLPSLRVTDPPSEAVRDILYRTLEGRVVFVGADLEQTDRHQTPLGVDPANRRTIPGVAIQATVFTQLLDGRAPPNAPPWLVATIVAALAMVGAGFGLARWDLVWKAAATLAVLVGYLALVYGLALRGAQFLPTAPAVAAVFLSSLLAISLDSVLTQRKQRLIRRAFSHYLAPAMVDQLAEDPEALRLGGDRREISLIFTDIEGFTTMSEELPPDQLTRLLNDYFNAMSEVIMRHGGAIDKFIGDAVVAHFGSPRPLADHALKALLCAEELDRVAEAFRRQNAHLGLGVTRIGVHTGVATVGNFGGRARFDYTAMGDAVNTASRLEDANKRYGTRVAISRETVDAAAAGGAPLPLLLSIGQIRLKGKSQPVTVFALDAEADADFVAAYEAAFALIETDPPKARTAFEEMLRARPGAALPRWHLGRLRQGETGVLIDDL
ncbi:adenylate/guanylate cyclase domain-containing protein [Pikeienuella piscinae]|uniref:Adenylate/guanylate cyclase domain-containing protein n=1 Tax=Pikeienuella piscinae TaxID=2748098 RepID=A0A7L5BTY5_9RHOB|nr:adenylate/guanylate cyclase domain-containing protein [Pikeienuella piscinae]QIE54058.1 adenylate/guanylate cyclase domain-containing protein [Pikeienuella piscinae]